MFTEVKIVKKKAATADDKKKSGQVSYQQGFSPEGQALLARPWIKPDPEPNFEDFTLASYIEGPEGYHWNDET